MNKKTSLYMILLFALFVFMPEAVARDYIDISDGTAQGEIINKGEELLYYVIGVVMILGGFGLVGISIGAIFGKVNWKWAAYLAFGLFICAITFSVLYYFTGNSAFFEPQMLYDTVGNPSVTITPSE